MLTVAIFIVLAAVTLAGGKIYGKMQRRRVELNTIGEGHCNGMRMFIRQSTGHMIEASQVVRINPFKESLKKGLIRFAVSSTSISPEYLREVCSSYLQDHQDDDNYIMEIVVQG